MGLYDEDNAAVTSGDVLDVTYWQAKFAADRLEAALKTRQPESQMRLLAADVVNLSTDVLKTYPNHADLKRWKERAESIGKKVDPNAPPGEFKGNFAHWRDYAYEAGWRSYHVSKMAAAAEEWGNARTHANEAVTQFTRAEARMALWPEDVQQWIRAARPEMEKLAEDAAKRA